MLEMLALQFGPMLYAVLAPLVTELVKMGADKVVASVPKNAIPIMSGVAGAIAGGIAQAAGDPTTGIAGLTMATGAVAGLAGTGLHQAVTAGKYQRRVK